MLSRNLEQTLHKALAAASDRQHEYTTLEHLLLALTVDHDSLAVLRACGIDVGEMREQIETYLDTDLIYLVNPHVSESSPTTAFQRVLQNSNSCSIVRAGRSHGRKCSGCIVFRNVEPRRIFLATTA